jgi:hypothetical protein
MLLLLFILSKEFFEKFSMFPFGYHPESMPFRSKKLLETVAI